MHLILLAGQICFASLPIAGRLALANIPPGAIPLVRTVGGALVFSLIAWQRGTLKLERKDIPFLLLCALLGTVLNQELFIHGLAQSTATNASVLGSTAPVFAAIAAIALGHEPARAPRLVGMAVAFAGVAALVGAEELSMSSDHFVGSMMILLNAISYGSFLVIVRPLARKYDPIALLAFLFLAATPMVAPIGIHAFATQTVPVTAEDVAFFAYLIAVPTVCAYALIQIALQRAESSLVAAYIYLQPVFAAVGAALVLDEEITIRIVVGGAIVLFGVWLAARVPRRG